MFQNDNLLHGAIDMHVHFAPDPFRERKSSALGLARQTAEAGMRGVVLKAHHYCSTPVCFTVNELGLGVELFGSLVMNRSLGGLNPRAVGAAAALGTRVLWMPTTDSVVDAAMRGEVGLRLTGEDGGLLPEVGRILEIAREHDLLLCTGHIAPQEVFALVGRAVEMGIKTVVTHPLTTVAGSLLSLDQQGELADMGAFIEHCYVACTHPEQRLPPMKIAEAVKAVGAGRCVLDTDFGQDYNPTPVEGMRMMIAALRDCGLSDDELESALKTNPARLLGIDLSR
ncbi:MAG: DUF6282 family protein [Dehalococcoidia bacterium]|nr:DUF6282 family protein [Dehalococcoidia bacterium]